MIRERKVQPGTYGRRKTAAQDHQLRSVARREGMPTEVCPLCRCKLPLTAFPRTMNGQWAIGRGCKECRTS